MSGECQFHDLAANAKCEQGDGTMIIIIMRSVFSQIKYISLQRNYNIYLYTSY